MKRQEDKRGQFNRGYTLVELVAVLAIMAIIAAISIPSLIPWYQNYKATERQANAELIYTSAQANMVDLKTRGHLAGDSNSLQSVVSSIDKNNAAYPGSWTGEQLSDDPGLVCLTSVDAAGCGTALGLLLPNIDDRLSKVGFMNVVSGDEGCYYIEINPSTGYVYGVFYSEKQFAVGSVDQAGTYKWASSNRGSSSILAAQDIAYYGGGTAAVFPDTNADPSFAHIGYFEFDTSTITASSTITGGYFYDITTSGTLGNNGEVVDALHDANKIGTTAYGLISSSLLTEVQTPSGISLKACVCSNTMGTNNAPDKTYYFYQYDSTAIHQDQAGTWFPWGVTAPAAAFKNLVFYIDPNFAAAVVPGQTNTFGGIYDVRTSQQLQHIGTPLNSANHNAYLSKTFYQTHDIDINSGWDPIGQGSVSSNPFTGKFYGGYENSAGRDSLTPPANTDDTLFTITLGFGFSFNAPKATSTTSLTLGSDTFTYFYGLFGIVSNGTVSFMHISSNGTFSIDASYRPEQTYGTSLAEGILIGTAKNSTIANCTLETPSESSLAMSCLITSSWLANVAGGIVGCIDANSTISKPALIIDGTLNLQTSGVVNPCLGGIVGRAAGILASPTATIGPNGDLEIIGMQNGGYTSVYLGGMVGYSSNTSSSGSITSANVTVTSGGTFTCTTNGSSNVYGGSIAGQADGLVLDPDVTIESDATMSVTDQASSSYGTICLGGIVGYSSKVTTNVSSPTMQIAGTFTCATTYASNSGTKYIGGLGGMLCNPLVNPQLSLESSGKMTVGTASGDTGVSYSGGMVGYSTSSFSKPVVANAGTITCTASALNDTAYSGGIAGKLNGTLDTALMANSGTVQISTATATSTISGGCAYTGGLVGYLPNTCPSPTLKNTGTLICTANANGNPYVGGITGKVDGTLSNSSVNSSGTLSTTATSAGGVSAYVGGMAGLPGAAVTNATFVAGGIFTCTASGGNGSCAGSISGSMSSSSSDLNTEITSGTASVMAQTTTNNSAYAGGLVGISNATLSSLATTVASGATLNIGQSSTTTNNLYTGGVVGYSSKAINAAAVQDMGTLTCTASAKNGACAGGIVGWLNAAMTYASAEIPGSGVLKVNTSGSGTMYTGGMIGFNNNSAVSNSYLATEDGTLQLNSSGNNPVCGFAGNSSWGSSASYSRCYIDATIATTQSKGAVGFAACDNGNGVFYSCYVIGMFSQSGSATGSTYGFMCGYPQKATACYSTLMLAKNGWTTGTYIAFTDVQPSTTYFTACYQLNPQNGNYCSQTKSGIETASYSYMTSTSQNLASDSMYAAMDDAASAANDFVLPSSATSKPGPAFATTNAAKLTNQKNPFPTATKDSSGKYISYGNWPINPTIECMLNNYGGANKLLSYGLNNNYFPSDSNYTTVYSDTSPGSTAFWSGADSLLDNKGYMYQYACTWRIDRISQTTTNGSDAIYTYAFYVSNDISAKSGRTSYSNSTTAGSTGTWLNAIGGKIIVYYPNSQGSTSYVYPPGLNLNTSSWQPVATSDNKLYAYRSSSLATPYLIPYNWSLG